MNVANASAFAKFWCEKCQSETSGYIEPAKGKKHRFCPICRSPLLQCNHCHRLVSGTSGQSKETKCDGCQQIVSEDSLNIGE